MTRAPLLLARATVELENGDMVQGFSSDLLVPKWFEKDLQKSAREDVENLLAAVASAREAAIGMREPATVFDLWLSVYSKVVGIDDVDSSEKLVSGFGVSIVERAVMDAVCRSQGVTFFQALKRDLFQFRPALVNPLLRGYDLAVDLPDEPVTRLRVRHTVGMADALRRRDVALGDRLDDGLPESLEEDVERYGLTCFKVKLCGDVDQDVDRVVNIATLLDEKVPGRYDVTVDGNEQFPELERLLEVLAKVGEHATGKRFVDSLLYIEQPLPRHVSLHPDYTLPLEALDRVAPTILDEGDFSIHSFVRAVELGYHGVSIKNCKGVFRALLNRGLCSVLALQGHRLFQSGEDLTNLPCVALQEDLATMSALGMEHVERNGHHYFRGLEHLPGAESEALLKLHGDLYERRDGLAQLRVQDGWLDLSSVQASFGFGYEIALRPEERTPLASWAFPDA
ncbi:MAG: hypothetical protein H6834_08420 [Planctomycetes bacterium]|nr:hypothetical protein [Planctomycetota bacterium]